MNASSTRSSRPGSTLERTTEGTGPVADRTARELAALGVPNLQAVLDVYAGTPIELHVEIKTDALGRPYEGLEKRLLDVIARRKLAQQAIVTSFVPEILETVRRLSPQQRVLASLDRLEALEKGGATLFFGHDPDFWKGVPQAPVPAF